MNSHRMFAVSFSGKTSMVPFLTALLVLFALTPNSVMSDQSDFDTWRDVANTNTYTEYADLYETRGIVFQGTLSGAINGTGRWSMNALGFSNPVAFYNGWSANWGPYIFDVNGVKIKGGYFQFVHNLTLNALYVTGYVYGGIEGVYEGVFDNSTSSATLTCELTRTDTTGASPTQVSGTVNVIAQAIQPGKETLFPSVLVSVEDPYVSLPTGTFSGFFNSMNHQAIGQSVGVYDMTHPYFDTYVGFGDYFLHEAALGPLSGYFAYGSMKRDELTAYSCAFFGDQNQEDGNIGLLLGQWAEDFPDGGFHHYDTTCHHAKTASPFFLLSPMEGAQLKSPPTFGWSADGHNLFSVDFSYDPSFATVLWRSYENGGYSISTPYWTMPESLWCQLRNTEPIYWRVRGARTGTSPMQINTTEIRSFTKGGIELALVHEPDRRVDHYMFGGSAHYPQVSADATNHVYVVWEDWRNGFPNSDIYLNYSVNHGSAWESADIRLDTDLPGAADSREPRIAGDGNGRIYVVWYDRRNGAPDICLNYSTDYGASWQSSDIRLDTDAPGAATSAFPEISLSGTGYVWVTWRDDRNGENDVYFNYSSDYGATWQPSDIRVDTDTAGAADSEKPQICGVAGGHVYVAWTDSRNGTSDIYFNYSTDYGASWQPSDIRLNRGAPSSSPQISGDGAGHVYVTWLDARNGGADIYFNYSTDYGVTWQPYDVRLNSDAPGTAVSLYPQMSNDENGHVYVTWAGSRSGNWNIYINCSSDYGVTWNLNDVCLTTDSAVAPGYGGPRICSDDEGRVYVAWDDYQNGFLDPYGTPINSDIFLNHSPDYGKTWQSVDVRIDGNPGQENSWFPQLTSDTDGNIYLAWEDQRSSDSGPGIYFAHAIHGLGGHLKSPPIFNWSPSSCLEAYSVDFSTDPNFGTILWKSYEDGGVNLAESYWAMPLSIWNQVPANQTLYWRVRGAESDDLSHILTSDEAWPFLKPAP